MCIFSHFVEHNTKVKHYFLIREVSVKEKCIFLTLFKKPLTPPLSFEHYVVNFSEGILTKLRKPLSQQLSTK